MLVLADEPIGSKIVQGRPERLYPGVLVEALCWLWQTAGAFLNLFTFIAVNVNTLLQQRNTPKLSIEHLYPTNTPFRYGDKPYGAI